MGIGIGELFTESLLLFGTCLSKDFLSECSLRMECGLSSKLQVIVENFARRELCMVFQSNELLQTLFPFDFVMLL